MKKIWIVIVAMICLWSRGDEVRTWTTSTGQTVEGKFITVAFDKVNIEKPDGKLISIPLDQLSDDDKNYVELLNPPKMKVEYRESAPVRQYVADPWISNQGYQTDNHPIFITPAQFGVEVIQTSNETYTHELTIEMFVFTKQRYDPDNYHLIVHSKSKPFTLTKENKRRFEYEDENIYKILKYNLLDTLPRGEQLGEFLMLVRDERKAVVGYNSSKKWLYNNLDKLEKLPLGAWLNRDCDRIHPTSPLWDQ